MANADDDKYQLSYPIQADALEKVLQLDFQHATISVDLSVNENKRGLFANSIMWVPDENGISQGLRESIQQESLRILNQALPSNQSQ